VIGTLAAACPPAGASHHEITAGPEGGDKEEDVSECEQRRAADRRGQIAVHEDVALRGHPFHLDDDHHEQRQQHSAADVERDRGTAAE
jgi:hypothetical protein